MSAQVVLKVIRGKFRGKTYVFPRRTVCLIGRAEDCQIRLPNDAEHRRVSRHHCLLDIDPPSIYVQDFGSRNGTFVNSERIAPAAAAGAAQDHFPERALQHGDRLRIGDTIFRVYVLTPQPCALCGSPVPAPPVRKARAGAADTTVRYVVCRACRQKRAPASAPAARTCRRCGAALAGAEDITVDLAGLCPSCQANRPAEAATSSPPEESAPQENVAIEGYRFIQELGRRRHSAVYLARHAQTLEVVALKVMYPRSAGDRLIRMRFLREAQNMMVLHHPHVVHLRDAGWSGGAFYFSLEYCEAGTVARLMQERGSVFTVAEAAPLILQVLDALDYCHTTEIPFVAHEGGEWSPGHGLVHRDIKPSNLFLTGPPSRRVVKIGDFGLAKAYGKAGLSGMTMMGMLSGTPFFMPRQQVLGYKTARPEVDVWAAAATFFFMLTGFPPRDFTGEQSWIEVVLETAALPIRQRLPSIPARLADVIDSALVDRPAITFSTAADFKKALLDVL